jgi:hypothetical protein
LHRRADASRRADSSTHCRHPGPEESFLQHISLILWEPRVVLLLRSARSPAKLDPESADFLLLGSNYSHVYQQVPVTPTGTPGEYRTSVALASDIPMGYYKLYCVHCTLSDGSGNFAPNSDIGSDETAITSDDSAFLIGPATATTATTAPPGGLSTSLLVGLGILVLIVILIAALLLRPRKKKT